MVAISVNWTADRVVFRFCVDFAQNNLNLTNYNRAELIEMGILMILNRNICCK